MPSIQEFANRIVQNVEKVIVGKTNTIRLALVALLADGHVLFEDVPGVAKTVLARSLAKSLGCRFQRVQCTPDLMPTDVTGASVFNPKVVEFEFRPGPVFTHILLSDEINRTTPRTQSALLECMAERQVTVDGQTYPLERPFMVIATQNPVEHEGTFPLPEAQLDRFLVRLTMGYPSPDAESEMLQRTQTSHPLDDLGAVSRAEELLAAQAAVRRIGVTEPVRAYIIRIVTQTRVHPDILLGASPRASQALFRAAQALAGIYGSKDVLPDHVKWIAPHVLEHRLMMNPEARLRGETAAATIRSILDSVPV